MKLTALWIVGAIGFLYGGSWLGPAPGDSNLLGFSIILISFGMPLFFTIKKVKKQAEARNAMFAAAKALYDKSLFDLQEDPTNSNKHQEALTRGREYYSFVHPNTYDMHQNGMSSNLRDNAGIVEAKVQSDIQARIGKGKVS